MLLYEVGLEGEKPLVGTGVGSAEGFCGGEGYASAACPAVHVTDVAGEVNLSGR